MTGTFGLHVMKYWTGHRKETNDLCNSRDQYYAYEFKEHVMLPRI